MCHHRQACHHRHARKHRHAREHRQQARERARAGAPPGQNQAKVLDALKGGGPTTAPEIAKATGIGAGTVSTLLNKMTKTGELAKAERGYALPQERAAAGTTRAAGQ